MSIRIADAIAAYSAAARPAAATVGDKGDAAPAAGASFGDMLKNVTTDAIDSSKQAEELQKAAIAGKASLRDVVAAVNNAELTLETVVAVRDKVISAYNDILRMPI